jgi:hypothetical protein
MGLKPISTSSGIRNKSWSFLLYKQTGDKDIQNPYPLMVTGNILCDSGYKNGFPGIKAVFQV